MNIILSPHFDDAVLSLGGLLAKEGTDSLVVTVFAGTPQEPLVRVFDTKCGFADSTEAVRERTKEDRNSLRSFGVSDDHIRTYTHLESQYRHTIKGDRAPEPELESSITQEIVSLTREFAGQPLKIYIPGLEAGKVNVDHLVVKRAALAAVRNISSPHTVEYFFYQDLPYAADTMERAYPSFTVRSLLGRRNRNLWDYSMLERSVTQGSLPVSRNVIPLERVDMDKKLAGVSLYTSQVNSLGKRLLERLERFSAAQARSLMLNPPYCEVVYRLDHQP
jgi:LmbE family N-acetylglucosaminyl deacetylase